jgi:hypothetical protein
MSTSNMSELAERLRELMAKATPALFAAKPHRIAQMLRDGAHAQVPRPDHNESTAFNADALLIAEALNALPALLKAADERSAIVEYLRAFARQLHDPAIAEAVRQCADAIERGAHLEAGQ